MDKIMRSCLRISAAADYRSPCMYGAMIIRKFLNNFLTILRIIGGKYPCILSNLIHMSHWGLKDILIFSKDLNVTSRGVVTLFHFFTIAMCGKNCFDMQH